MVNTVQHKRGTTAQVNSYTGAVGEFIYNTTTKRIHAQDGVTAGGIPHALVSEVNLKANESVTISAGAGLTGGGTLAANRTLALSSASIASLALADSAVQSVNGKTGSSITLTKADVGLSNVDNTSDASKPVSTATQTALNAKANSSVTVSAGTGLTGGGNLTANRSIALNSASIASLGKADTALQAPGGTTGQILAKNSNTTNDVAWVSSEAATAVSYASQTLTDAQKSQARANIDADKVYNSVSDVQSSVINSSVMAIRTNGYSSSGDGGGALYKRVATEPTHAGKIQSADGSWWEISGDTTDIRSFGVKFDGAWNAGDIYTGTDNTAAINNALAFKQSWDLPGGICLTNGNHVTSGQITGAGIWQTTIVCTNTNPNTKIFTIHTLSRIDRFRMVYNGNVNVAGSTDNQFIALALGTATLPLCKGGGYGNISIGRCGTGVWSGDNHTFACRLDNLELREFYYIGVDVMSGLRTPNHWGNIYMNGSASRVSCHVGIRIGGAYSDGDLFGVVHIESINCNAAIQQSSTTGTRFEILHLEDVNQKAVERCFFEHRDGATCNYGRVSLWYCVLKNNGSFFGGYSSKRDGGGGARSINQDGFIDIDHLEVTGLFSDEARTQPVNLVSGFKFFANYTGEAAGGVWYVSVNNYTWYSFAAADDAWYRNPNLDETNIRVVKFGKSKMFDVLKNVRTLTSSGTLSRFDSVIIVSAASGNVVITLPLAIPGKTREIIVRRIDSSANTVSYAAQPPNSLNIPNTPAIGTTRIIDDGFGNWVDV